MALLRCWGRFVIDVVACRHCRPILGPSAATLLVAILACSSGNSPPLDSGAPPSDSIARADSIRIADSIRVVDSTRVADSIANNPPPPSPPPPAPPPPPPSGELTGIPFGDFHLPRNRFVPPYTGALLRLTPEKAGEYLDWARTRRMRLVIALAPRDLAINSDGTFSMTRWRAEVDKYRDAGLESYIADGTILGHYVIDEPFCGHCWGGDRIASSTVEDLARYSKSIWPSMATGVRAPATLTQNMRYQQLDFAWAQWEGPLHVPSHGMTPEEFRDAETAAARERGLGLVFGLNYLDAGDGSSGIPGTYKNSTSPKVNRWQMTPAEVRKAGAVFAAAPLACGLLSWKYEPTFLARGGVQSALEHIAGIAKHRERTSCKRR